MIWRKGENKNNNIIPKAWAWTGAVSLNMIIYSNKKERKTVCQIYEQDRARHGAIQTMKLAYKPISGENPKRGDENEFGEREREEVLFIYKRSFVSLFHSQRKFSAPWFFTVFARNAPLFHLDVYLQVFMLFAKK